MLINAPDDFCPPLTTQREEKWTAYGFSKWKRSFIPAFLGGAAEVQFVDAPSQLPASGSWLVWSSKVTAALEQDARDKRIPLWRMEDGFIRSAGLGVDLVPPVSLVLDSRGIYYDATRSSDLEWILRNTDFDRKLLARAQVLMTTLVTEGVTKYNVGLRDKPLILPRNKRILLVPGQVETDASILLGSPRWRTNQALLQQVRKENPDAFVIYKPHPDVLAGGRASRSLCIDVKEYYDLLVTDTNMSELLNHVDEVHTLTSLTGFEALLRGVKVVTYGMPFYAGWGLTTDYVECDRRGRLLSLEELVAAVLILYPVYRNPDSNELISPEAAVEFLRNQLGNAKGPSIKTSLNRYLKKMTGRLN